MKRKIFLATTLVLVVAMLLTPFAVAKSWEPKNNEKFESFAVTAIGIGPSNVEIKYSPSEDAPNLVVETADENMQNYQITIDGSKTYVQDVDFTYSGHQTWMLFSPQMPIAAPIYLTPVRMMILDVKYSYTFLPASGIEGTIYMHAIAKGETIVDLVSPGGMLITSLDGTGDFRNVNIKATSAGGGIAHIGTVIGWPE